MLNIRVYLFEPWVAAPCFVEICAILIQQVGIVECFPLWPKGEMGNESSTEKAV